MKTTLSIIKADIGSIGGYIKPSQQLIESVQDFIDNKSRGLANDLYVSYTGDDIALLFSQAVDVFDHPFWDYIREKVSRKAVELREQGFSGAAMLPYSELEYGGIVDKIKRLDKQFKVRD